MESKFNPKLKSAPCSSSLRCIRATCTGKEALLRRCRQTRKPLDLTFCSTRGRNAALWPVHPAPGACSDIGRYWTLAADWSDWSASPGLPYHLCRAALSRSCRGDEQAPPQKLQILCHPLLRDVPLRFGCLQRWRSRVKVTPPSIDRHRTSLTRQWPSGSRHNDRRQAKAYACIHHSARLLLRPPPSAATAANNGSGTKRPAPPAPDNAFRPCPGHFPGSEMSPVPCLRVGQCQNTLRHHRPQTTRQRRGPCLAQTTSTTQPPSSHPAGSSRVHVPLLRLGLRRRQRLVLALWLATGSTHTPRPQIAPRAGHTLLRRYRCLLFLHLREPCNAL